MFHFRLAVHLGAKFTRHKVLHYLFCGLVLARCVFLSAGAHHSASLLKLEQVGRWLLALNVSLHKEFSDSLR